MANSTKISIITTSYNYENYIKETIESVQAQTYKDWEMIIVDDGSTDNSVDVIKSYVEKDSRIKLFQHENCQNKGLCESLKLGITKSQGDWLIILESDDTIVNNYIEEKLKIINENKVDFIFNDVNLFGNEDGFKVFTEYFKRQKPYLEKETFPSNLFNLFKESKMNLIPTFSVVMVRKNILENLDFNAPYKPSLDWYLWLQLIGKYQFYYVNQKLTNWRIHKTSYAHKRINNFFGAALFEYKKNVILKEKFAGLKFILDIITCIRKYLIRIVLKKNYFRIDILNCTIIEKTKCKEDK